MILGTYDFKVSGFCDIGDLFIDPVSHKEFREFAKKQLETVSFDYFVGLEARGFVLAGMLAADLEKGMIMCRKPNKLPGAIVGTNYKSEYEEGQFFIQPEKIKDKDLVLVDDIAATWGSLLSTVRLCLAAGAKVMAIVVYGEVKAFLGNKNYLELQQLGIPIIYGEVLN